MWWCLPCKILTNKSFLHCANVSYQLSADRGKPLLALFFFVFIDLDSNFKTFYSYDRPGNGHKKNSSRPGRIDLLREVTEN